MMLLKAAGVDPEQDLHKTPDLANLLLRRRLSLRGTDWSHPYSREVGAYPAQHSSAHDAGVALSAFPGVASKYWPPVRRVDQAFGDRNLVCACPPIEAFA